MEVGTPPSRVRHHLVIVAEDAELAALAFTVNDEDTDPDGTDAHDTVGTATGTVVVVVGATVVVVVGATVVAGGAEVDNETVEFKVYEP